MSWRLLFAAAALLVGACDSEPPADEAPAPSPAIYELASPGGQVEGWMFGTIHALPDGTEWRTERIDAIVGQADMLVVEIAALEDSAANSRVFERLARSPGQPDLLDRVDPAMRPDLLDLMDRGGFEDRDFAGLETWAAALSLARVMRYGDSANGVDRALIREFSGRPIDELEGFERQLAIFDRLPESEQRDLLGAVVADYRRVQADPARLAVAWRAGDLATLERESQRGMLADPELRAVFLSDRNRAWAERLVAILAGDARPLIAVGAAHLVGTEGLPSLLEQRGYTVTRIQ